MAGVPQDWPWASDWVTTAVRASRAAGQGSVAGVDYPPVEDSTARLHRWGWTVADARSIDPSGKPRWIVSGLNGEKWIRAEGATCRQAWCHAVMMAAEGG